MHHYTEFGLPNVYLANGYHELETPYGRAISVEDVDGLHQLIGTELADRLAPLSSAEFRFLRKELDLTQDAFARLAGTKVQNVSNWERAERAIPPAVDCTLRALYLEKVKGSVAFERLLQHLAGEDATAAANAHLEFEKGEAEWRARAA